MERIVDLILNGRIYRLVDIIKCQFEMDNDEALSAIYSEWSK